MVSVSVLPKFAAGLLWLLLAAGAARLLAGPALAPGQGPAAAIALLTLFVAAIVASFSQRYMRADGQTNRYFLTLIALVAAVLGFLFSGNLAVFAAAWVASGWLLAALIGHAAPCPQAAAAARRARWTFAAGDAALIGAFAILATQAGSLQLADVLAGAAALPAPIAAAAALLLLAAAAARSALPPTSGWLLSSMTAPTPVSALMHAGLVNAGGFLLIRFAPVLEAAPAARIAAIALGLFAAIYGIGIMLVRPDVKRSLAGSTISQMGFMIMSCGLGAYAAALWHIIAHGLFKAWLFLGSGSALGMQPRKAAPVTGRVSLAVAGATLALALLGLGQGGAGTVPLLLGIATAAASLAAAMTGSLSLRSKGLLLAGVAGLIALHGAGLILASAAAGPDAAAPVPGWALLALLAGFLGVWVWQQHRQTSGRGLPLPLYVHLINAGNLPPVATGDAK